ncbi:2578_t:CDS:2 [Diversispora eburnea]|uniref:2578_t:CDS:1 n=1 Tax=Diversispora eburnea TaxID=1213867 RepID=A0A9N8WFI4_9GLOM|nr:2578_t:CDS:2 [Diversispora eburnea]
MKLAKVIKIINQVDQVSFLSKMIDHILGKPSPSWKRIQVFYYLITVDRRGPAFFRKLNDRLSKFSPFQLIAGTLAMIYMLKNVDRMVGFGAPEPLARLYSRNYYRATWIITALDAGFWTAMTIRPKFLRDIMSLVFALYYLIFADQADEKARRVRSVVTVEHIRVAWEKTLNPCLHALIKLSFPPLTINKKILIPRPQKNSHGTKPVSGYLYYAGSKESFENCDNLIINYPGGGFVSMSPPCHDYLPQWAAKTKSPIISIDYGKAPEYPYPYALEECFDVYQSIVESNGEVIGMAGWKDKAINERKKIKIVLVGDSAGGNLVTSVMYKILESPTPLPHPTGLILVYPCLDFNIACWMSPSQLSAIRAESTKSIPGVLESKDHLSHKSPLSVVPDVKRNRWRKSLAGSTEDERTIEERVQVIEGHSVTEHRSDKIPRPVIGTRLAMTSRMSFFNDRIVNPDLMRAMAILYIGPNNYPDFASDYLLSPIIGPDELLAQFPKTYLMCGEKDPFVDDTVVLAGRIREAKRKKKQMNKGKFGEGLRMSGLNELDKPDDSENNWVEVKILQGISHAFLQMYHLLPESKGAIGACALWMLECFRDSPQTNNILTSNVTIKNENDERLIFGPHHSNTTKFTQNTQNDTNISSQISDNVESPSINQVSNSISNASSETIQKQPVDTSEIDVSASRVILSPGHERERVLWEQQNILHEHEIMNRRRETLVRNLAD